MTDQHRGAITPRALLAGVLAAALILVAVLVGLQAMKAEVIAAACSSAGVTSHIDVLPIDSVLSVTTSKESLTKGPDGKVSGTLDVEKKEYAFVSEGVKSRDHQI